MGFLDSVLNSGKLKKLEELEVKRDSLLNEYRKKEKEFMEQAKLLNFSFRYNAIRVDFEKFKDQLDMFYTHLSSITEIGKCRNFNSVEDLDAYYKNLKKHLGWFENWLPKVRNIDDEIKYLNSKIIR